MDVEILKTKVQDIVGKASALKNRHIVEHDSPVNYACIFSQSREEYDELITVTHQIGKVIKETSTGLLFQIEPIQTSSGILQLLKIRIPDITRPELGDADFTITNFPDFEERNLGKAQFKRIEKENFYMIELMESGCDVRAYFSNPPLDAQLGVKESL